MDACHKFPGADTVFVEVVAVGSLGVAVGIGVFFPASAVIDDIVDAPNLIFATDTKSYGIVFAIFGGREVHGA